MMFTNVTHLGQNFSWTPTDEHRYTRYAEITGHLNKEIKLATRANTNMELALGDLSSTSQGVQLIYMLVIFGVFVAVLLVAYKVLFAEKPLSHAKQKNLERLEKKKRRKND